jgi:hypothetical protein
MVRTHDESIACVPTHFYEGRAECQGRDRTFAYQPPHQACDMPTHIPSRDMPHITGYSSSIYLSAI